MNYKKVIGESWKYTQQNKKLIFWYGFIPSILTTSVAVAYIAYSFFAFKKSYLFNIKDESFLTDVINFIFVFFKDNVSLTVPVLIFVIIFGIIYLLYPTLAKASAIQMIARNRNGQKAGVGTGLQYGLMSFLRLFEYHLIIKTFAFFSIIVEMAFVLRNLGIALFYVLLPFFIIFIILSFILTLLFVYSDFFIVIDDGKVFESMRKSAKLVVTNWTHTFLITILMIIIGIRIFIQAIMVFLIPALIVVISGYISVVTLPATGMIIGGIIGFVALLLASYLNGIVDIFSYSVWTFTFLELSEQKEFTAREKEVFTDEIKEKSDHHYSGHKNLN